LFLPAQNPVDRARQCVQSLFRSACQAGGIIMAIEYRPDPLKGFRQRRNGLFFINAGLVLI